MSAPELRAGDVVAGKYTIRSLLSHGGAMATYRAIGGKSRDVVVKVYDPAILAFHDLSKTLGQHRSIGATLSAQEIVPIVDSGTDPKSGAPFTVTDFDAGLSLAQLIDKGPLSTSALVGLVHNLARVTDRLHANGITSLSLHPGNVFVRPEPQYEVRIADFGASAVRNAVPVPELASRWMPWLAPEQIKGQAPPAQPADIFALGLIAFFAVTGRSYWRSGQTTTLDAAALRREILSERLPASMRAGEFSITLNPAVNTVFARSLAFRAAERYATARDFAVGLEAALSGRSVAEVEAARPMAASANVKAAPNEPPPNRESGDALANAQRIAAPPPRKMQPRATMVGVGNQPAKEISDPSTSVPGPRKPMATMLGMGTSAAEVVAAAGMKSAPLAPPPLAARPPATKIMTPRATIANSAIVTPPPAPTAVVASPARAAATTRIASPAKPYATPIGTPAKPAAPATTAMYAEALAPAPPMTATQRFEPPALPMAPPPAQMEALLARFEASGPAVGLPATTQPATTQPATPLLASAAYTDGAPTPPAWSTADFGDVGAEKIETGVAVVGTPFLDPPKSLRMRWIASIGAILLLVGTATWALSRGGNSTARDRTGTDARAIAAAAVIAPPTPTTDLAPLGAAPLPIANTVQVADEAPSGATPLAAAPAPPPPIQEPEALEPAAPTVDNSTAKPTRSTGAASPIAASGKTPAVPRAQPSQKPCGKFLKRCK